MDVSPIRFYTGFPSSDVLMAVFEFLGQAVSHLHYIGSKSKGKCHRKTKLEPLNQFFMMLMKLRLDLNNEILVFGLVCHLHLSHTTSLPGRVSSTSNLLSWIGTQPLSK